MELTESQRVTAPYLQLKLKNITLMALKLVIRRQQLHSKMMEKSAPIRFTQNNYFQRFKKHLVLIHFDVTEK